MRRDKSDYDLTSYSKIRIGNNEMNWNWKKKINFNQVGIDYCSCTVALPEVGALKTLPMAHAATISKRASARAQKLDPWFKLKKLRHEF